MTVASATNAPVAYWRASDRLAPYVSSYQRFTVALPPGMTLNDAFFPTWATIRIALDDPAPWSMRIGPRTYTMPVVSFTGPTSYAGYCSATHGSILGIGLLPLGWATLFGGDVSRHANRVIPLADIAPDSAALHRALADTPDPVAPFEKWLGERLERAVSPDPMIARIQLLIEDPATQRAETISETLGISPRHLAGLTRYNFGFTPKLLLRRGRFLRALSDILDKSREEGADSLTAAGYWDRSHFLRDCHLFLGCSVRDFRARRGPLNALAMKVRADVIGTSV